MAKIAGYHSKGDEVWVTAALGSTREPKYLAKITGALSPEDYYNEYKNRFDSIYEIKGGTFERRKEGGRCRICGIHGDCEENAQKRDRRAKKVLLSESFVYLGNRSENNLFESFLSESDVWSRAQGILEKQGALDYKLRGKSKKKGPLDFYFPPRNCIKGWGSYRPKDTPEYNLVAEQVMQNQPGSFEDLLLADYKRMFDWGEACDEGVPRFEGEPHDDPSASKRKCKCFPTCKCFPAYTYEM